METFLLFQIGSMIKILELDRMPHFLQRCGSTLLHLHLGSKVVNQVPVPAELGRHALLSTLAPFGLLTGGIAGIQNQVVLLQNRCVESIEVAVDLSDCFSHSGGSQNFNNPKVNG